MPEVPDSVFVAFLKAGILAPDESLKIIPLRRWWRFYSIPDSGFIITDKKVIAYTTGFRGLSRHRDCLLRDIVSHTFQMAGENMAFHFVLQDGLEFSASMKLSEQDGKVIETQLCKLLTEINQ